MKETNIKLISNGIVRNLLKSVYYLRIPKDSYRKDRVGKTIAIPSTEDVEIDYKDWKLIEFDLISKDRLKILKIIKYPETSLSFNGFIIINNYTALPLNPVPGTLIWAQYSVFQGIYYWDEVRNSWLSENQHCHTWNSTTDTNVHTLNLVHNASDTQVDNDANCSIPSTIVGLTASQANQLAVGSSTRFTIGVYDIASKESRPSVAYIDLTTPGNSGVNTLQLNIPIDINTSEGITFYASRIRLTGSASIARPALTMWYRNRLTP